MQFVDGQQAFESVLMEALPRARRAVRIATADIKNLHVPGPRRPRPFLAVLAELVRSGVEIRLLHAKEPGPRFRRDFDRFPELLTSDRFERALCPRVHFKLIVVDRVLAYVGSANLTGAGIGMRSSGKRNFEAGMITRDPAMIDQVETAFDDVFLGSQCAGCGLRRVCPDPIV